LLSPFSAGRTVSGALCFLHFRDTGCVQVMYIQCCVYARKSKAGKVCIALEEKVVWGVPWDSFRPAHREGEISFRV